ncbi:MAG: PhnD/SsuA/transferrin family substrate-binding protein [bacterium]|nr:PhnD/SsuA/transferrin family substrate-binding protein [Candidatus Sumerlaeota bacterium]
MPVHFGNPAMFALALLWLMWGGGMRAHAQSLAGVATSAPLVFRIGHITGDPESPLGGDVLYALRDALVSSPLVQQAMREANVGAIAVLSSDSHQDLIQRMDQNEFDLVFCSSVDFVQQNGDYEAVFQLRRPRDSFDPNGGRVFHRGVVFVNNRSPLFSDEITSDRLGAYLSGREIAMVGSFSAAGYIYPLLKIAALPGQRPPPISMFCDSSEEVVKNVVNGAAEIGACDGGVIEEVLARNGLAEERNRLVRIVMETDPIPTEPVALRANWLPRGSAFGRELRDALRQFFARDNKLPRLQNSSRDKFLDLKQNLQNFRDGRRTGSY